MLKIVTIDPVMTKPYKHQGIEYPAKPTEYKAQITLGTLGESITVQLDRPEWIDGESKMVYFNKTFKIGDECIYDSYNLYYTGTITKITEKAISIWTGWYKGRGGRTSARTNKKEIKRLSIHEFCWRNYNFDSEEIEAKNNETSKYI